MSAALLLLLVVILVVLAFEYINGFHDTANAIATVVSTKVLTPRQALLLASLMNLVGSFMGQSVAKTIQGGILDDKVVQVTSLVILAAMLGAIAWNLITWWFGMPSSSSHALIGGLIGAGLAKAEMNFSILIWSRDKGDAKHTMEGIYHKVVIPMIGSPLLGLSIGFVLMGTLFLLIRSWRPLVVNKVFGVLQIFSAGYMGLGHGKADAQKTMGIIMLALVGAASSGELDSLPPWLDFLRVSTVKNAPIPFWITVLCAATMAAGTYAGGWRIIKTLGHKMVRMKPVHGFAAETTAATILYVTGELGMPVSTTHTITTSIMGVGAAKRWSSIKWVIVERIVWAWIFTIPASGLMAYLFYKLIG
jgi:PiT family inorganic phosphate transporter